MALVQVSVGFLATSPPSLVGESYAAFRLQVAPCTADLDSLPRTGSLCALANPRQVTDLLSFLDASEQQLPHPHPPSLPKLL